MNYYGLKASGGIVHEAFSFIEEVTFASSVKSGSDEISEGKFFWFFDDSSISNDDNMKRVNKPSDEITHIYRYSGVYFPKFISIVGDDVIIDTLILEIGSNRIGIKTDISQVFRNPTSIDLISWYGDDEIYISIDGPIPTRGSIKYDKDLIINPSNLNKTFEIRYSAYSSDGSSDPFDQGMFEIKFDSLEPMISFSSKPDQQTSMSEGTFTFNCNKTISNLIVDLDGTVIELGAVSGYQTGSLPFGTHIAKFRAIDTSGFISNELTHTWEITN